MLGSAAALIADEAPPTGAAAELSGASGGSAADGADGGADGANAPPRPGIGATTVRGASQGDAGGACGAGGTGADGVRPAASTAALGGGSVSKVWRRLLRLAVASSSQVGILGMPFAATGVVAAPSAAHAARCDALGGSQPAGSVARRDAVPGVASGRRAALVSRGVSGGRPDRTLALGGLPRSGAPWALRARVSGEKETARGAALGQAEAACCAGRLRAAAARLRALYGVGDHGGAVGLRPASMLPPWASGRVRQRRRAHARACERRASARACCCAPADAYRSAPTAQLRRAAACPWPATRAVRVRRASGARRPAGRQRLCSSSCRQPGAHAPRPSRAAAPRSPRLDPA